MYLYNVNKTRTMNEKEEISALLHRLTQLKMELKMTEFTFKNNKKFIFRKWVLCKGNPSQVINLLSQ